MKKDNEIQDVPYKYYPKIYLYMLKNYIKSINYKSKNDLNNKINKCIQEYKNIIRNDVYKFISLTSANLVDYKNIDREIKDLLDFIFKFTVAYQIKYDNQTINEIFSNKDTILNKSFYDLNKNTDNIINFLEKQGVNLQIFDNSFIKEPDYKKIYEETFCSNFKINEEGIIYDTKDLMGYWNDYGIIGSPGKYIEGKHIKDIKEILETNGYAIENINGNLNKLYEKYNEKLKLKELVLTAVLYNIIKSGNVRFGPRRGLLFSKEYGLNIDIPMTYGVESTYYDDYKFINIYLNNGGNKDFKIFVDYFGTGIERCFCEYLTIEEFINNKYSKEKDIKKMILKNTAK